MSFIFQSLVITRDFFIKIFLVVFCTMPHFLSSQITVIERTSNNVELIGKISHTSAFQKSGLSRELPILDPLIVSNNSDNISKYKEIRKDANDTFKTVGLRKMTFIDEEFSASLIYFNDRDKYLLTFKNSEYNYQNESFWISPQTKKDLHELIVRELNQRHRFKNIEVVLDNNVVLVMSINRKKISFNLWDGYTWIQSYWYREFKVSNLFGN